MPRGVDRLDEARHQGRRWTPRQLRPVMWFDAQALDTITTASGVVSQWSDRSGFQRHATQATAGLRPMFQPTGWDGQRPTIRLGDTSHTALGTSSLGGLGLTSGEVFTVQKNDLDPTTGDANTACVTAIGNHGSADHMPWTDSNTYLGWFSTTRKSLGNLTPDFSQRHIVGVRSAASDWALFVDGTSISSTGTNTFGASSPIIGSFGGPAYYKGLLSELLIIGNSLSTANRQRVEGYLAWKWGLVANLPASHPFKNRPPLIGD